MSSHQEELAVAAALHVLASLPGYRGAVIIINTSSGGQERAALKSSLPGHMAVKLIQRIASELKSPGSSGPARLVLPS